MVIEHEPVLETVCTSWNATSLSLLMIWCQYDAHECDVGYEKNAEMYIQQFLRHLRSKI